jgi:RNA ligase (TIGR02306 family)
MSECKSEIVLIDKIDAHPNADRLELATVKGWQCVVQKGAFKAGDKCLYIPIDSILPHSVDEKVFGPDSKVKLSNSRVRTIKLRGAISQGLVVDPRTLGVVNRKVGTDVTAELGITKYEPPVPGQPNKERAVSRKQVNPHFHKYTSIENFKNYPHVFDEEEIVVVTEKIHGTNFRCGWVPTVANTFWKKIKKFFGMLDPWEFVYGSHNVQLQDRMLAKTYYGENVYAKCVKQYDLKRKIQKGEVIYGEIYGSGIQKGYDYGCKEGERKLVIFDIKIGENFVSHHMLQWHANAYDLDTAPLLYIGNFNLELIKNLAKGDSFLCPAQKVREGVVIKPLVEQMSYMGRKVLKLINDEYLLKEQTDFH